MLFHLLLLLLPSSVIVIGNWLDSQMDGRTEQGFEKQFFDLATQREEWCILWVDGAFFIVEMDKDANVARWGFSTSTFQHMMASWDSDVPMNGGRTASCKDQCWWKSSKRSMAPIAGKHCVPKPTYSQDKMLGWSLVDTLPDVRALHSPSCRSGTSHRKEKTSSCPKNLSTREASRILCLSSPPSSWLRPCLSSCASQPTVAPSGSSPKPPP